MPQLLVPVGKRVELLGERRCGTLDERVAVSPPDVRDRCGRTVTRATDRVHEPGKCFFALADTDVVHTGVLEADVGYGGRVHATEHDGYVETLLDGGRHREAPAVDGGQDAEGDEVGIAGHDLVDDPGGPVEHPCQPRAVQEDAIVEQRRVERERGAVPFALHDGGQQRDRELFLTEGDECDVHADPRPQRPPEDHRGLTRPPKLR